MSLPLKLFDLWIIIKFYHFFWFVDLDLVFDQSYEFWKLFWVNFLGLGSLKLFKLIIWPCWEPSLHLMGIFFVLLSVSLFFSEGLRVVLELSDVLIDIHTLRSIDHNEKLLGVRPDLGTRSGPDELFDAFPILSVKF